LATHFRREFLGRLDRTIEFRALTASDFRALLDRALRQLASQYDVTLTADDGTREQLCRQWGATAEGARGFYRHFEREVTVPLLERLRTHPASKAWSLDLSGETAVWREEGPMEQLSSSGSEQDSRLERRARHAD
jgi:ATP-dependent Clp protease ATP-binding subunit ClpA